MKSKLLVLGVMLSCLLGLTACGQEINYNSVEGSRYQAETFNVENLRAFATTVEDQWFENWYLQGITPQNFEEKMYFSLAGYGDDYYEVIYKGYDSWCKAVEELGYSNLETLQGDISVTDTKFYINSDGVLVAQSELTGTTHTANMEMYFKNNGQPTDIGVTVNKSTPEKLGNAGLNTLLGMGMAFAILIIISLIISLFPLFIGGGKKKKESDKEITQKAMDNATNQIAEQEELTNDAELVAVIAAAIAAYEGSGGTDGFVVRSIRKRNTNWKNN
ncbi:MULTISPECIES: OadG family transporter subunit [unclassified Butyrivibrio]|uniref:OadG family transporter subunit n=1 Tax=unclassified Butyrivibrio TaxID=2639466 RepID=UPI000425CE42|nr:MULTISPECIES: OadG family transporter subunit [unclassified Butyrivibrio]MDC7292194.1 OadG family transporter subunit [Butyrivibrio sp. DSM 10294]